MSTIRRQWIWVIIGSVNGLMPDGTNVDWSSVRSGDIHLRAISQVIDQPSVTEISLKITHFILIPQGPMSSSTKHLDVASSHSHSVFWQKRKKKNECVMVGIRAIMHIFDDSDSDSDSDRGLFNIKLHTKVLHQVYIAKQYEHFEQIWTWHNQKIPVGRPLLRS